MLPPRMIERLPDWARHPVAGQVAWKWAMPLVSLASTLALLVLVVRWARRRAWDGRVGTLLARLGAPLAMLVLTQPLRVFLDN